PRAPGARAHLSDHHALSRGLARAQHRALAARLVEVAVEDFRAAFREIKPARGGAPRAGPRGARPPGAAADRRARLRRETTRGDRDGARPEAEGAAARRAPGRPVAGGALERQAADR